MKNVKMRVYALPAPAFASQRTRHVHFAIRTSETIIAMCVMPPETNAQFDFDSERYDIYRKNPIFNDFKVQQKLFSPIHH